MLQTEKYKFNIIETSDTFSPDALNANARTAEAELAALAAAEAADKTALERTLAAQKSALDAADAAIRADLGIGGKNARIVYDTYVGSGESGPDHPTVLTFDFKPNTVFISSGGDYIILARGSTRAISVSSTSSPTLTWGENSVSWHISNPTHQRNFAGTVYHYVAIGEPL